MALMLDKWTPGQAKKKLGSRLDNCRSARQGKLDKQWEMNERTVFTTDGRPLGSPGIDGSSIVTAGDSDADVQSNTGVNYSFKNVRYIHAQMSSNPPATIPRPSTSDPEDRRRARAADRVMRYALRQYGLQEKFDQTNLNALIYGTGFLKTTWDSSKGDIVGMSKKTGQLVLEGDINVRSISPWKMFVDPDADTWEEVRYVFEELTVSREEALHRWPTKAELIDSLIDDRSELGSNNGVVYSYLHGDGQRKYESITVYEYWEKGMPSNAMLGRYAVCLEDGRLLEAPKPSPFAFSAPPSKSEQRRATAEGREPRQSPPTARLPYHIITDIDVPSRVWGKSFVEFEAPLQEILNRLDSVMLENLQAHGVARLILPDGLEIAEGAVTNSPWDVVRIKDKGGTGKDPKFMDPMPLPATMGELRAQTKSGIDDMAGVNESMFGQQSREQSGFSMQYAVNQGSMIRRRLFNKYVLLVESVYRAILDLVRKHWKDERSIQVLGNEKAFEVVDLKGSDIDGGYDLVVEYGTSLSLDPLTRRQEIMNLMPILEKAAIPPRVILGMLKLGELDVVDDLIQMAEDRQREIFEEMIATGMYIKPEEFQDHENMLAYCLRYVMTSEFKYLEPDEKEMVRQHIRDRGAQAATEKAPASPAPTTGTPPGPMGTPGAVPGAPANPASAAPAGAVSQPADIPALSA